jgi:chromate transporter
MDATADQAYAVPKSEKGTVLEVLGVATRLGLTSFGGPIAHLGYFHTEYVTRRRWLTEQTYADLVALCQFLPGPASSQVGIAIGMMRAGLVGGVAAWLGFTLPSALVLVAFAYGLQTLGITDAGWLHGLKVVAVAVVAQAVWGMARTLAPDRERASLAFLAAIAMLAYPTAVGQVLIIVLAGLIGWWWLPEAGAPRDPGVRLSISHRGAAVAWGLFFGLLIGLPIVQQWVQSEVLAVFDGFFRVGSLVFGGGHVVLPLLQAEVGPPGWVTNEQFVAGYGAAQAVPGPLFTFAAYLGVVMRPLGGGVVGAALWDSLRPRPSFQAALRGINAAVVGLLLAALYHPVWTSAIHAPADVALGLVDFALLMLWKWPPWLVVVLSALGGAVLAHL